MKGENEIYFDIISIAALSSFLVNMFMVEIGCGIFDPREIPAL